MTKRTLLLKKPILIPGKSIEVYACGGQCRGKSASQLPTSIEPIISKKKKLQYKKAGDRLTRSVPSLYYFEV